MAYNRRLLFQRLFTSALAGLTAVALGLPAAQGADAVKLGVLLPLTGASATGGKRVLVGVEIAVEEINAMGGVLGRPLEVIVEDSESTPKGGMDAVHKLIDVDKVPVVIGENTSSVTIPTATYANSKGVVQIGISATAPAVRKIGPYFFSAMAPSDVMAKDLVEFAIADSGQKKFGFLTLNDAYGVAMMKEMTAALKAAGGEVVSEVLYEPKKPDYRAELQRLFAAKPPAILSVAWFTASRLLHQQAYELGLYQTVADTWYSPFVNLAVEPAIPETVEGRKGFITQSESGVRSKAFTEKYKTKSGEKVETAPVYGLLGYDSVWIAALAINQAGSLDAKKIQNTLPTAFGHYRGISDDDMSVDGDGMQTNQNFSRMVFRDGKLQKYDN